MSATRSSYITLYASDNKADDSYKAQIDVSEADVKFSGVQDLEMDFANYIFKKSDDSTFDLETRFGALESDATGANNASAITALQADLAAEIVARGSADTTNGNLIAAETTARTNAVQAVQDALDVQEAKQEADRIVNADAISAEASSRATAVADEETRALAAEASLQSQITNILSNADAAVVDSIAELLSKVDAEDASLLAQITTLQSDLAQLRLDFDALVAQ